MKKIISFSLFNNFAMYNYGIIANIYLAKQIFPDWICRVYCDNTTNQNTIEEIKKHNNTEIYFVNDEESKIYQIIWRFWAIDDPEVSIMICRDADARLSNREKICVNIFENSDYLFHSIRDNRSHFDTMGGMWGIKQNNKINIKNLSMNWHNHGYDSDQKLLREQIRPVFKDSILIHCSQFLNTFPEPNTSNYFVGGKWDENNFGKPLDFIFF